MPASSTFDGHIMAPIYVGTKETCPPGKECPGKIWGANYCAIFGEELERAGGRHRYHKCKECVAAELARVAAQERAMEPLPIKERNFDPDVFKDFD